VVRTIDGEARRQLLADAVWRLLRAGGLKAASVRAVASEAGLSAGSVRHFFKTQDDLHIFAMQELIRRMTQRVEEALRAAGPDDLAEPVPADQARRRVRAGLLELLPMTAETTADFHAHLQFIVKAVIHPPLGETALRTHQELEEFYLRCLDYLADTGAASGDLDRHAAARDLAAVMDGLVLRRLTAPTLLSAEQMTSILDAHLDGLGPEAAS
jgi:AcrR family transcriptional regulator